jgi:hypothetical protein
MSVCCRTACRPFGIFTSQYPPSVCWLYTAMPGREIGAPDAVMDPAVGSFGPPNHEIFPVKLSRGD